MTKLSINLNKVALLRNSRGQGNPSLLAFANTVIKAGAHGITIHPRPDERHIVAEDAFDLKSYLRLYPNQELNIEGNPFEDASTTTDYPGFIEIIRGAVPHQVTLVPDKSNQLTSNHGWDLEKDGVRLEKVIKTFKDLNIRVSLFVDVGCAAHILPKLGADRVELYTEKYADDFNTPKQDATLKRYLNQANKIDQLGLEINAGHDLNQLNLSLLLKTIPQIKEVSIGHALICESLYDGITTTVKNYLACITEAN